MNPTSARFAGELTVSREKTFDGRENGSHKRSRLMQMVRIAMNSVGFQKVYRNGGFGWKRVRKQKDIPKQ
jgi:hypothetical protein